MMGKKKMMKGGGKTKKYMAGGGKTKKYMAKGGAAGGMKKKPTMMKKGGAAGGMTMAKVNAFLKSKGMKAVKV